MVGLGMASVLSVTVIFCPHDFLESHNSEIDETVDRSIFQTVDMDSSLDHLSGIVDSIFEGEKNSSIWIFIEIALPHNKLIFITTNPSQFK